MPNTLHKIAFPLIVIAAAVFIAAALFLAGIIPGYHLVWTRDITEAMVGERISLDKPAYRFDTERSFQGDGYTFMVFEPDESFMKRFDEPGAGLLKHFPRRPEYRKQWEALTWRRGPVRDEDKPLTDFALGYGPANEDPDLMKHLKVLKEILESETAFYGSFYQMHGERVGDVDLYVVDTEDGRVYLVNLNT